MGLVRKTFSTGLHPLRERIQQAWNHYRGVPTPIISIRIQQDASSTTKASVILRVESADNTVELVFLKEYDAKFSSKMVQDRFRREEALYRYFFSQTSLGTAAYRGSMVDEVAGKYWLMLEAVFAPPLSNGGRDEWVATARWLARLQAAFESHAPAELSTGLIQPMTAADLINHTHKTRRNVERNAAALLPRLDGILAEYDRVVSVIVAAPPRLVHGSFNPKGHVLADTTAKLVRICPIDWETAAYSAPVYDLAHIVESLDCAAADLYLEEYLCESTCCGASLNSTADWHQVYTACRLHAVMHILRRVAKYGGKEPRLQDLMTRAENLWRAL